MTRRQLQLLAFIRHYRAENGNVSPSCEEMMVALGLHSKGSVHRIIDGLEERGHVHREGGPNRARNVVPTDDIEFERGRAVGRAEGYRQAVKDFGKQGVRLMETA